MHRSARRWTWAVAASVAAAVAVLGFGVASSSGTTPKGAASGASAAQPLVIDAATPPSTLDPAESCPVTDFGPVGNMYVSLTQFGTSTKNGVTLGNPNKIVPYLATKWKSSDSYHTWTFTLRSGVKFPNGDPLNGAAVKFTYERLVSMGGCASGEPTGEAPGKGLIKSIDTPNATTVVFHLSIPISQFPSYQTNPGDLGIVDPSLVSANGGVQAGKVNTWIASHDAGSGPYVLKSYTPGVQMVLTRNPRYFGRAPLRNTIKINFITSDSTLLLDAENGSADVTEGLSASSFASLKGKTAVKLISFPIGFYEFVSFPNKSAPFNNVRFREALTYAVPYKQIQSKVVYGYGALFYGPFPPGFVGYNASLSKPRTLDLSRAKALIKQSGVKIPITLTQPIYVLSGDFDGLQVATVVQSTWAQLGITVKIDQVSSTQYAGTNFGLHKTWLIVGNDGPDVPTPFYLGNYDERCTSAYNRANYCNPQVDSLLVKSESARGPAQQAIWNQIQKLWVADSPRIPLYQMYKTVAAKPGIKYGYTPDQYIYSKTG